MSHPTDTYKTLCQPSAETLYKEKGSKFYGYAFPVGTEQEVATALEQVRERHKKARHICYAYQTGTGATPCYRANDAGEPANTAGMPIYGQIQSFGLTNVLVVVVRYFGGVKLGVGGLISAYRISAKQTLELSQIVEKTIDISLFITFDYKQLNQVMYLIKKHEAAIRSQQMTLNCTMTVAVRKQKASELEAALKLVGVAVDGDSKM